MTMGLFVAVADFARPTFASGSVDLRNAVLRELRSAIETARRVGGRYLAVIPGKRVAASCARTTIAARRGDVAVLCRSLREA